MEDLVNQEASFRAYHGCNVLITGHTGFKGSWLALTLMHLGANVHGFALAPPDDRPSLFDAASVSSYLQSSTLDDICDLEAVRAVYARVRPQIVFHAAAQSLVRRGYAEPLETFSSNVLGTVNVLDAARGAPATQAVVIVTSDKCYESQGGDHVYEEGDPLGGSDPYSASKGCAELVAAAYRRSYFGFQGPLVATVRSGNVIGGGDWAEDRLVPDMVRAVTSDRPAVLRNPTSVRPWQHVLEPLRGYLMLGAQLLNGDRAFAEAWNFGPSTTAPVPVRKIAATFLEAWGEGKVEELSDGIAPREAERLVLDSSKAKERLGWMTYLTLTEGIILAADWYRRVLTANEPAFDVTMEQVSCQFDNRTVA